MERWKGLSDLKILSLNYQKGAKMALDSGFIVFWFNFLHFLPISPDFIPSQLHIGQFCGLIETFS